MKLLITSGKGGVGKTASAVHLAAASAARGISTTLVDADPQRNAGFELGVGVTVEHAQQVRARDELTYTPSLDVDNELVVIDSPPGRAAADLYASVDHVLIPFPPRHGGIRGLAMVGEVLATLPDPPTVAAVYLWGWPTNKKAKVAESQAWLAENGLWSPTAWVRWAEAPLTRAQERGETVGEYAQAVAGAPPIWTQLRDRQPDTELMRPSSSLTNLAADIDVWADEIIRRLEL